MIDRLRSLAPARAPRQGWRSRQKANCQAQDPSKGFTILEALIAVVILTASISGLAILSARQSSSSTDVDVLDRVENAVATDLGWLKSYAKYWRMSSGPYDLCPSGFSYTDANGYTCSAPTNTPRSGASSFTRSTTSIEYEPDPSGNTCPNPGGTTVVANTALASAFVSDAASSSLRPTDFAAVAVGDTTLLNSATDTGRPRLPAGTTLLRTISLGRNLIFVSYSFNGDNAAPYRFRREAALHPEAAAWCP